MIELPMRKQLPRITVGEDFEYESMQSLPINAKALSYYR